MALTNGTSVFVTGGCGFVGANLGRLLSERGCRLVAFDNLSSGHKEDALAVGYEDVVVGDIRDAESLTKAAQGAEYFVHLAARTGVMDSVEDPRGDVETNVIGTLNALLAARDVGASGFTFASSNAPLGSVQPPVSEDKAARPMSPYGASKAAGEALTSAFAASYDLNTTMLRFSNVYGPYSYHKGSVVALFFKRIMEGKPLTVYGDGRQTRDFIFADDLCRGIVAALDGDHAGEVFHLGTGSETTIQDLVQEMAALFPDQRIEVEYEPERPGEIRRNYADIGKARRLLGFAPETTLAEGLRATKEWFEGAPR